ncbi:hypothetical protein KUCAC02_003633, partial [Chaenocephalus aceratus]
EQEEEVSDLPVQKGPQDARGVLRMRQIRLQKLRARLLPRVRRGLPLARRSVSAVRFRSLTREFCSGPNDQKTPKPSEELILLQAGLGRRSAHVSEDADHKEITNILCEVYPKMAELEGFWLIHKATASLTRKCQSQTPLTGPDQGRAGDERGKNPKYNVSAYQDNTFRYCGEIFAASVVQGGPPPHVLTHHTYHYLCHGQLDKDVVKAGTASVDMENLVTEVQDAEEDSLMALTDRIIACGYSGPIKADHKKDILELLPILQQLRDGLALYGLDELLVEQPLLCQQLFVPGSLQGVDADFLILALSPEYSPEGSVRRQCEMRIVNLLQDYLQELEDKGEENPKESQEEDLNTCSDIKPPTVKIFSAITIPTRHFEKASEFEVNITEAILAGFEFNLR